MRFSAAIYGSPVPQGRPRATVIAGHAVVYDPKTSRDWKRDVKAQLLASMDRPAEPYQGAMHLYLTFWLPRPKSLPKKVTFHTKKPDLDNLAKAVKDAMKSVIYRDDSQVILLTVRKEYSSHPGVLIEVESVE